MKDLAHELSHVPDVRSFAFGGHDIAHLTPNKKYTSPLSDTRPCSRDDAIAGHALSRECVAWVYVREEALAKWHSRRSKNRRKKKSPASKTSVTDVIFVFLKGFSQTIRHPTVGARTSSGKSGKQIGCSNREADRGRVVRGGGSEAAK